MVKLARVSRAGFYRFDEEPGRIRHGSARRDPEDRAGMAQLRAAAHHRGTAPARLDGEPETRLPADARGQSAVRAEAEVRGDHRFQPRAQGLSEPGADMVLTAIDQLWRADITYIRLRDEFVFLAVILDAYSRRVIGWALDRTWKMN